MNAITYTGTGFGVEDCPGCSKVPEPYEQRVFVPGIWRVWHLRCFTCLLCDEHHNPPFDGSCLL